MHQKKLKIITWLIFISYFLFLFYMMFIGFYRNTNEYFRYNLVPFRTISSYIKYYEFFNFRTWMINLIGNIGVFIPFGILLPLLDIKFKKIKVFLIYFLFGILTLEILQLIFRVGSFDIDDIILNTLGGLIGQIIYHIFSRRIYD